MPSARATSSMRCRSRRPQKLRADLLLAAIELFVSMDAGGLAAPRPSRRYPTPRHLRRRCWNWSSSACAQTSPCCARRWGAAPVALAALLAFAGIAGSGAAAEFARLGCAGVAAAAFWRSYLPGRSRSARRARRSPRLERLALRSGLVTAAARQRAARQSAGSRRRQRRDLGRLPPRHAAADQ